MQYDPKLKKAKQEIEAILDKYDIGGSVVLHSPGWGEHFMKINPSYSCAFYDNSPGVTGIRVRTRLQEDFNGDAAKRNKSQEDTVNMFVLFAELIGKHALHCIGTIEMLEKKFKITHNPGNHSTDQEQNN